MKNADDAIDRVLTGLRDAEVPEGMERRILAAMENRALAPDGAGVGWRLPLWLVAAARPTVVRYVAMGFAAAGVIALVVAIPTSRRQQVRLQAPLQARQAQQAPPQSKVGSVARQPGSVAGQLRQPRVEDAVIRSEQASAVRTVRTARVANEPEGPVIGGSENTDSDQVALSETRAASFPAPPMPLTEQERLILRMVQRGETVELAMLDPRLEAMRDAEEKEKFQRSVKLAVKDAEGDWPGAAPAEAGAGQSSAEPAREAVVTPVADGVTEQAAPDKTEPPVANPEQPNGKESVQQPITTEEKD